MTKTPAEIAMGLSKQQAGALKRAEPDGHLGLYFVRWWHANSRTLRALRNRGLGTAVWSGIALNQTGLAVRAALLEGER